MSLFKKIIRKIVPQQEEQKVPDLVKLGDQLKNADPDYKFAQLFTHSGGYFNYCGDEAEALQVLNQIVKLEQIDSLFCWESDLISFLDVIKAKYTPELSPENDAAFITCEHLIAYDGSIMLSANNIKHYPSSYLPEKIILLATVSQIEVNLSDAMGKVMRRAKGREIPKNLTSISGNQNKMEISGDKKPKLFLLLLEA